MSAVLAMAGTGIAIPGQALAAISGLSTVAKPPGIAPDQGAFSCPTVSIIGVRGSGQTSGSFYGFGPQVYKAVTIVEGYLNAKKVHYAAGPINYPAVSVNVLDPSKIDFIDWTDYLNNHLGKFASSIAQGTKVTVGAAEVIHAYCPKAKFVMIGYSQGAMVMQGAELTLEAKDRGAFNQILGTVMIADGNRVPNTKAKEFGSSPASGEGIDPWVFSTVGLGQPFKDVPLPATTANICNNNDLVCDTRLYDMVHYGYSSGVHTTSYAKCGANNKCTYYPALINGATWVAKIVASTL
jgi:hypothetical protein